VGRKIMQCHVRVRECAGAAMVQCSRTETFVRTPSETRKGSNLHSGLEDPYHSSQRGHAKVILRRVRLHRGAAKMLSMQPSLHHDILPPDKRHDWIAQAGANACCRPRGILGAISNEVHPVERKLTTSASASATSGLHGCRNMAP
jgi:hypothetical protein